MIVKCTNCGTKFKVKDDLIPPEGRKVRCSRCKNIFVVKLPQEFEEKTEKKEDIEKTEDVKEIVREESEKEKKEEDIFHLSEDEIPDVSKKTEEKIVEDKKIEEDIEKIVEKYKKPTIAKKLKKEKSRKFSTAITIVMLIIAIFVSGLFIFMKTKNKVPPFKFSNLTAQYYENKKFKTVLVVKGELKNLKNYAFKKIKLKALIYDNSGKKVKEATTYLGNIFSKSEILNMTPELSKKFLFDNVVLKPNSTLPFMIFVFNLPKKSYSFQVMVVSYEKLNNK